MDLGASGFGVGVLQRRFTDRQLVETMTTVIKLRLIPFTNL